MELSENNNEDWEEFCTETCPTWEDYAGHEQYVQVQGFPSEHGSLQGSVAKLPLQTSSVCPHK